MSSNSKFSLDEVKSLIWLFLGWTYWLASGHAPQPEPILKPRVRCIQCGNVMRVVDVTRTARASFTEFALSYLDSG